MLLFFADDARQMKPTRSGMSPLIAAGAIGVPETDIRVLELQLSRICSSFGFPEGEEFKWSPGRDLWMASNLVGTAREQFYQQVLETARQHNVSATVVIEEAGSETATGKCSAEEDVTRLLLEGIQLQIPYSEQAIVVADRPGGGRSEEDAFLASCFDAIKRGTRLLRNFELIALLLTTNSKLVRLVQLADLITSCTTALVAGEERFAPVIFQHIRPVLRSEGGRIGGVGLKIHPADRCANLYHWILGDRDYMHHNSCYPLPLPGYPYAISGETC